MSFPAFLDTCVLYRATLTDTLLRTAEDGAFRPQWSADVLSELQTVLVREAGLSSGRARRRIAHMQAAFPDAAVLDYQALVGAMTCDQKDRHVLAGAVAGGAAVLVTFNRRTAEGGHVLPHSHP